MKKSSLLVQKKDLDTEKKHKRFFFYVLLCKDYSFYAGYTTNLKRRLQQHNSGKGAKYTRIKSKQPMTILYFEEYPTKSEAMKMEAQFKKLTRSKKEQFLNEKGITYFIPVS